ncbi:MAG: hypothetical protein F9K47_03575 [Burkholderiales bacterium]|nr:MAG: hypothetical protein F9K47_03575 [Burkholderiales bacterium]
MGFDGEGTLYLADGAHHRVIRVVSVFPGFAQWDFAIASDDGNQLYRFDSVGRHAQTLRSR